MKKLLSLTLVLLMLMGFYACGSFTVRSDSVYIKIYNNTKTSVKSFALDEYENTVLKSTIVAENADGSSYLPNESLIFEVLGANPDTLSLAVKDEDESGNTYVSKIVSASVLNRGIISAYSVELSGESLVLNYLGVEE